MLDKNPDYALVTLPFYPLDDLTFLSDSQTILNIEVRRNDHRPKEKGTTLRYVEVLNRGGSTRLLLQPVSWTV